MSTALRNQLIRVVFEIRSRLIRLGRTLRSFRQPRIGVLDHITIPVRDLAIARAFYCDVLGGAHSMTVDDETFRRFGRPKAPNGGEGAHHVSVYFEGITRIDLFVQRSGQPSAASGHPHFAFRVPPRHLFKWKSFLETRGVPTDGPLQLGPPGQASLYFNDPFGNHLELTCMGLAKAIPMRPPVMSNLTWGGGGSA